MGPISRSDPSVVTVAAIRAAHSDAVTVDFHAFANASRIIAGTYRTLARHTVCMGGTNALDTLLTVTHTDVHMSDDLTEVVYFRGKLIFMGVKSAFICAYF